jgi:uncharacterized protein (DUF1697 family)
MALVAFLRGANVGGHRRFRPSLLARELQRYDVVNVGATGLFVVRKPGSKDAFRSELLARLPFDGKVAICDARDVLALAGGTPFDEIPTTPDAVRFVSVLVEPGRVRLPAMPLGIPSNEEWFVRMLGRQKQFVFGEYRRHMKTIGYLGQIDKVLGAAVTTRNWNTIASVLKLLKD